MPDTIKDEWIEDIEALGKKMDEFINAQKEATGFDRTIRARWSLPKRTGEIAPRCCRVEISLY
jgi:hypothetical protein